MTIDLKENKKKTGRRLAREELFKLIFETELLNEDIKNTYTTYLMREKFLVNDKNLDFLKNYIEGISQNINLIKNTIKDNMENWEFKRIGNIEKSLLIIATYEILKENIAPEIVVNEAVELAKEYGDIKTPEFINGVLAKIIGSTQPI